MSKIKTDPREAQAEMEKIRELRAAGGDAAVAEYFLKKAKEADDAKKQSSRRENQQFTQIYEAGWKRLQTLIKKEPQAARLYAFLAEHMGPDGTISASRPTLAEALEMGTRTISRHIKVLEKEKAIFVLKLGTANVYCLDPREVWKSFDNAKPYAAFNTKALVGKTENPFAKKRLTTVLEGKLPEQKDWVDELDEDVEAALKVDEPAE